MSAQQSFVPSKLRHIQTFTANGTFYPSSTTTQVYVVINGASGGGQGGGVDLYKWGRYAVYNQYASYGGGQNGGPGIIVGGYVQVNPNAPHAVVIGSGGSGGSQGFAQYNSYRADYVIGSLGGNAGTTHFDSAIFVYGGTAYGASGSYYAQTSLTTQNPSESALPRVSNVTQNNTTISGGNAGYGGGGGGGSNGVIYIYGY
jgi:hypothetical protein